MVASPVDAPTDESALLQPARLLLGEFAQVTDRRLGPGSAGLGDGSRMQRLGDPGVERVVHQRAEGERGDPVLLLGILHRRDTEHVADEVGVGTHGPLLQAGGRHDLAGPGRIGEDDTTEVAVGGEVAVEAGVVGRQAGGEELGAGPDFGPDGGHDRFGERATRLGVVEERPDVVLLHGRGEVGASESGDEGRDLDEPLAGTRSEALGGGPHPVAGFGGVEQPA